MGRIEELPRRNWRDTADVQGVTNRLKTSAGTQVARVIQAAAFAEAEQLQGLFLHGRVGCGKTWIAAVMPIALKARKALIIVPGKGGMVDDTERQHSALCLHWKIPRNVTVVSYEFLAQPQNAEWLKNHKPDAIICDEGHKLRQVRKAAVAIRVSQYLSANPHVRFAVMSGTLSPHGDPKDFAHLLIWALRKNAPIPLEPREQAAWWRALDGSGDPRVLLGAKSQEEAIRLFAERLRETPGVIMSDDVFGDVPLTVEHKIHDAPEETRELFANLRDFWEAPDGWSFGDDQFQVAACARQLGNGLTYRHDPRPPKWFLAIRKNWANFARTEVELGNVTSEGELKLRIRTRGGEGSEELALWEEAERAFPLTTAVDWHALDSIRYAATWAKPRGIIWTAHIELGEAIEELTGIPFYHGQEGRNVLDEDGSRCIVASIQANATGKNLQGPFEKGIRGGPFYHNLILAPPANGESIEQLIGRTHREGQVHPVTVEYYIACREHRQAVIKSIDAATKISKLLSPQKLLDLHDPPQSTQDHPAWLQAHRREKAA